MNHTFQEYQQRINLKIQKQKEQAKIIANEILNKDG